MKRVLLTMATIVGVLLSPPALCQEPADAPSDQEMLAASAGLEVDCENPAAGNPAPCVSCGSYAGCCACGPTWYAEFEAIAARYRRADGTSYDASDPDAAFDFGHQVVPRATAGVVLHSGLGVRLRYFDYDHADTNARGERGSIETTVVDLELFENTRLTNHTALEWSIGVRHTEFMESIEPHALLGNDVFGVDFEGTGLVAGLEVNRMLHWGSIYARGRGALLVGDRTVTAPGAGHPELIQQDITPGMLEFAAGWEFSHVCCNGLVLTAGVGWEVQQWMDFSLAPATALPSTSPVDVGFDGPVFTIAAGY
jgi:hypothetical protein